MTATTLAPPGPIHRILRALPLIGRVVRDIEREVDTIFYLIVIALTALVLAVQVWGLPALVLTAVAAVPVMFVFLILISRP
ncbi:MAG TPA: hypothetical protein PLM52_03845 [Tabrizicola sp.]|nr:hypothetical protein [Tabrizicola sp.]